MSTKSAAKHRVLLFGEEICKGVARVDNCDIVVHQYPTKPDIPDLTDFELVVLPYSPFWNQKIGGPDSSALERFDKCVEAAAKVGTWFCMLHYQASIPSKDYEGCLVSETVEFCRERQTGFRWLERFGILPCQLKQLWTDGRVKRGEFERYLREWGASWMYFREHGGHMDDRIQVVTLTSDEEVATAFALNLHRGKLLYIPCQTDANRDADTAQAMSLLVECVLAYQTKARLEIPTWASEPLLEEERPLKTERERLSGELASLDGKLALFSSAKHLLFESEYELQASVPKFVTEQLGIPTKQEEVYLEDFWLLGKDNKETAICEVKSHVKGFKKSGIYDVYNHREARGKDESFPAVLIANSNLNASSWQDKMKPIDKHDSVVARDNRVLVLRVEDLLYAWQAIRLKKMKSETLADLLHTKVGWLHVNEDGQIRVQP